MNQKAINSFIYKWRYAIGYTVLVIIFAVAIALAGLYAPGGLTQSEINTLAITNSLSKDSVNLVNIPFHGLQLLVLKLLGVSVLTVKIPAMIFAIASIVAIFFLLKRWFKSNITILSMLIMATTSQLIFLAQSATPQILYVLYSAIIILFSSLILQKAQKPLLWKILLAVSVGISLYTPFFIYINTCLFIAALIHPRTRYHILRKSQRINWLIALGAFALVVAPIVYMSLSNIDVISQLIGLNYLSSFDLLGSIKTLFQTYFWASPILVNDQIAPIFDFASVFIIILGGITLFMNRYTARSYVITAWLIITLPILLANPGYVAVIMVPLFILLTLGTETLLNEWYKLFPKNPYARAIGLISAVALISVMVFGGADRYMNGYRHMPEAVNNSSIDLTLLSKHLVKYPAKVQLIAADDELPLYQTFARFNDHDIIVATSSEARESTNILITAAARESADTNDLEMVSIITNDRASDGDRFYLYKAK